MRELPHDTGSAAIAGAIIEMARSLGLSTVAEGVETQAQRDWMAAHGCEALQGYLLARAMPGSEVAGWLAGLRPASP